MILLDFVVIICVLVAYFKSNIAGKKISLVIGGLYSVIKGIVCCVNGQFELIPMYILTLFLSLFFLYRRIKARKTPDTIALPIGQASVTGDKENFEICIVTDGKQYKFNASGDQITSYVKSGKEERYGC